MRTLRRWLIFSHILLVLLLVTVTGVLLIFVLEQRVILVNLSTQLERQAALVVETAHDYPTLWQDPVLSQQFADRFGQRMTAQLMLLDNGGHILASSDPADAGQIGQLLPHPELDLVRAGQTSVRTDYSQNLKTEIADIIMPVTNQEGQVVGMVRITHQLARVFERFQRLRFLILEVLAIGLGLGGLAAVLLAWSLERPVERLTSAIERLASGDELQPVPEQGPAELRQLAASFNSLIERLRILRVARSRLLANLVHELGRPLGALRSASQALLDGADDDPVLRRELLQGMDGELKGLQRLLDDLVRYYDWSLGSLDLDRQPIQPAPWLRALAAPWGEAAQARGRAWAVDIPDDLPRITIDADRLGQAIGNLLHNAIKFTSAGGQVALNAGTRGDQLFILVSDTGRGILPEDRDNIFEAFSRGRKGERLPEGMGLGLTIARDLVEGHDGRLEMESQPGAGTIFTIWLPIHSG